MKVKSTKRSLLVSGLLLLLCVSMLVGSTFAWFTDSVSSKNNIIKSGNLDVQLFYAATEADAEAGNWTEVDATTDIFGYDYWEPGYVKTAFFKVVNAGSLALKYQLSADVYAETPGVNKAGESFLLSDSIKTAVIEQGATREEILAMTGRNLKESIAINEDTEVLYPVAEADVNKPSEKVFGLAIWMPTTVGNEANHNGESVPSIDFGINLLATQQTYEFDSFGPDYDSGSRYPIAAFGSAVVDGATEYQIDLLKADGGKIASALILDDSVAEDAGTLSLTVVETEDDATVSVAADQDIRTFEITVTGLKEDNTVPVKVELNVGAGLTGVEVYHKNEKLNTVSYNATEGVVTFETYSFSPFSLVYDAEPVEEEKDETRPAATVEDVSATYANTPLEWSGFGGLEPNDPAQQLEAVFLFTDSHDEDWVNASAYKDWYCDFYVKMDKYVPENAVVLGGNYGSFGWVGFNNPVAVEAETWVPLLASFTGQTDSGWTYSDIATIVKEFLCGVAHCDSALDDATFTVQLRLTNPADSTDVLVVAEQAYTFGDAPAYAETAEELSAALAAGGSVVLKNDVEIDENLSLNGGSFDGNGNTLDAYNTISGSDCAITTTGGTVKNLTIVGDTGDTRAIGAGSSGSTVLESDLYIDNVNINKVQYAINGNGKTGTEKVFVTNSKVYGWSSFSNIALFSFENCTLGMGNSADGYLIVYGDTAFSGCTFEGVFDMGARAEAMGATITLTDCTYDGVKVTAENFEELFYYGSGDEEDFGRLMRECTIVVDGVQVVNTKW